MGNNQSTTVDNREHDTNQNASTIANLITETTRIPEKYFGIDGLENDTSLQQVRQDLLSVDDAIKRIFTRRKETKQPNSQDQQSINSIENPNYIQPIPAVLRSTNEVANNNELIWRCTYCTTENEISELACRRCRQAETAL